MDINNARFIRNAGLIDQEKLNEITIIGLGSIGSTIVQDITMMGYRKIYLIDFDTIGEHNLPTTRYNEDGVGSLKIQQAEIECFRLNHSIIIEQIPLKLERYLEINEGKLPTESIIICTDNMDSRKLAYEAWVKSEVREIFVDVRMASLTMQRVIATKNNDNYMSHFVVDDAIPEAPCALKHTVFTTSIIAGLAVSGLFGILMNRPTYDYAYMSINPLLLITNEGKLILE